MFKNTYWEQKSLSFLFFKLTRSEKDKKDLNEGSHASDLPAIINDLALGREPRFPADTPAKKEQLDRLQKDIDEAKEKGYTIFTPE